MTPPQVYTRELPDTEEAITIKQKIHAVKFLSVRYREKYSFMSKKDQLLMKTPAGFKVSRLELWLWLVRIMFVPTYILIPRCCDENMGTLIIQFILFVSYSYILKC